MTAPVLIFLVLPVVLIVASFWVKPLVRRGRGEQAAFNQSHTGAMSGMFEGHGLKPDPVSLPEETTPVIFDLSRLPPRDD